MTSCTESYRPGVCASRTTRPSLRALFERIFVWVTLARSRRDLAALDDRALRDIGIDRATAAEEASRPFWRSL